MKQPLAHPPQKPKRRAPRVWRGPIRKYAVSVGELIWAASRTQASLAELFSVMVDAKELAAGLAIWLSMQTDKGQSAALQALLSVRAPTSTRLYRSIQWALAAVEKLAEIRNDAAHLATSPTMSEKGITFIPDPIGNTTTRLQRRSNTDFLKLFAQAKGDYILVQQYVHDIFCHLGYPNERYPLPLRPKLKSVIVRAKRKK